MRRDLVVVVVVAVAVAVVVVAVVAFVVITTIICPTEVFRRSAIRSELYLGAILLNVCRASKLL